MDLKAVSLEALVDEFFRRCGTGEIHPIKIRGKKPCPICDLLDCWITHQEREVENLIRARDEYKDWAEQCEKEWLENGEKLEKLEEEIERRNEASKKLRECERKHGS